MNVRERLSFAVQMGGFAALMAAERAQTGVVFNPLRRSFRVDPYASYRKLQQKDPFHRSRAIGGWVLTRHADISTVLRDQNFFTDGRKIARLRKENEKRIASGDITREEIDSESMLGLDPPDHTRLRSLVSKAFTPRSVEALRPRIEQVVDELIDQAAAKGAFDVIREIAYPLPVIIIAEMLGIPTEDREQFKSWSDDMAKSVGMANLDEQRASRKAQRALRDYLVPIIQERRREPREDLLSALVAAEEEGDQLTIMQVHATISLLLVAGNETTTNLIGNGLLALLQHRDQFERLRDNPDMIGTAVEEMLRYDSPVQGTSRFTLEDTTVNGHPVRAGHQMFLFFGAANRDPEQFPDPETFDIGREDNRHLSFGHGIHFCLGAPLARIEGPVALNALVQRFPNMRLATEELIWGDNIVLRGLTELPVRV
ncbi:MAG TPA: cytochrome P450 [Dehalococcoidia bacterium]